MSELRTTDIGIMNRDSNPEHLNGSQHESRFLLEQSSQHKPAAQTYQKVHGEVYVGGESVIYTARVPDEAVSENMNRPISGYGAVKWTMDGLGSALALEGLASVTASTARGTILAYRKSLTDPHDLHVATQEAIDEDMRYNRELRYALSRVGVTIEHQDLLPNSMGGIPAVKYATLHPKRVQNINHLATVGFGSPTIGDIPLAVPSTINEICDYALYSNKRLTPLRLYKICHYYLWNIAQSTGEGLTCLNTDLATPTKQLGEVGITSTYTGFSKDLLVRPGRIDPSIANFANFEIVDGLGHLAAQRNSPEVVRAIILARSRCKQKNLTA